MRKWASNKIYKDDKSKEVLDSIQKILDTEFTNINEEVKRLGGIKNWKAQNTGTGYIVVFGSVVYYANEYVYIKLY